MTYAEICKLLDEVEQSKFKGELNPLAKATIIGGYILDRRLTDHECDIVHCYLSCKFDVKKNHSPEVTSEERSSINNYLALKMSQEDKSSPNKVIVTIGLLPTSVSEIKNFVISSDKELTNRQQDYLYQAFKPDHMANYMYYSRYLNQKDWASLEEWSENMWKTNTGVGFGLDPM